MARIEGNGGNNFLVGTPNTDSIFGFAGNDRLFGKKGRDALSGGAGDDRLFGGFGSDTLDGGRGDDFLRGDFGSVGEIDTLTGGVGSDQFAVGSRTQVLYDDGNPNTAGTRDYALITDFNSSKDVIQLTGPRRNYRLGASPSGLPQGTAIYLNKPTGQPDELVGIVQGRSGLSLNSNDFQFRFEFNLADLNGSNGFVLNGVDGGDSSGDSVSSAGDVNGDGFDDLLIGADDADPNGQDEAGESYVVFGKAGGFSASFDLATLNGSNGFVLQGIDEGDNSGDSVSSAGDVNGDGFNDVIVGALRADLNGQYSVGESYVVFGKAGGFNASLNLSALNGRNGFVLQGIDQGDYSGTSVSSAGDVNGDGFDDLIVGASFAYSNGEFAAGESYVVFGKGGGFSAGLNLANLNGSNGFVLNGIDQFDYSGRSVSSAGDVNGDGFDDLIVGASFADPNGQDYAGESYVVFGKGGGFSASLNLANLNGSNGFVLQGIAPGNISGRSVSSAGDVNGDGFDDLIVGASGANTYGQSGVGEGYVVFGEGGGFSASLNLANLNGSNGFVLQGIDQGGSSGGVSSAGDVNGDGFDDLIIGDVYADPNGQNYAGESYVVFGKAGGFTASFDLADLNGSNGFVLNGINVDDFSGSVSSAGDVNGDGFDDLIVGAPGADLNGQYSVGESYVVFGRRDFTTQVSSSGRLSEDALTGTGRAESGILGDADDPLLNGGTDTFQVNGGGLNLDLADLLNQQSEFDHVELTGAGNNRLALSYQAGLDDTTTLDGSLYNRYPVGAAGLLAEATLVQTLA